MKPVVSGIEDKYGQDFKIVHINVATNKDKVGEYNVFGTPTMIMSDESGRQVRRLMGYQSPEDLEKAIDRVLGR